MDIGHVILATALIVIIAAKLRTRHRRRFKVTFILDREADDSAESNPDNETP